MDPSACPGSLRLAVVTETYPPEVNGVAASLARIVDGLLHRGHTVQLIRPRQPADAEGAPPGATGASSGAPPGLVHLTVPGCPIPRYPDLRLGLPAAARLTRLWRDQRPDVVHIVTEGPLGWSALRAAHRLGLPVVSDFRTHFEVYSRHYGMGWLQRPIAAYLRRLHNGCACTLVPTQALRSELAAAGFQRLRVVSRGVDTVHFDPVHRSEALRLAWGVREGGRVALCVSRLAPEKNLELMLDALRTLQAASPGWTVVLVGDGPLRAALQHRHPEVVFAGLRRGHDLARHYASADLFPFPSLSETFGNVVPEALASGLPVLAFDRAAAHELVRADDNGWLVPDGDEAAFRRCVATLAGPEGQLSRLRLLGGRARASVAGRDWRHVVSAVEAQYRWAWGSNRHQPDQGEVTAMS